MKAAADEWQCSRDDRECGRTADREEGLTKLGGRMSIGWSGGMPAARGSWPNLSQLRAPEIRSCQ